MLRLLAAALALACLTAAADARPRHHHQNRLHHQQVGSAPDGLAALFGAGPSLLAAARAEIGNGPIYGRANLWCARFVNVLLARTGHRGTGSDLARSFARYGRPAAGPQPGAIAVLTRRGGGHVGVVSGVDQHGNPVVISGNHNGRVGEAVYPARRVVAYVVPE